MPEQQHLLELPNITGTLQVDDHELSITATITTGHDGTVSLTIDALPITNETKWLLQTVPAKGRLAPYARLRATSPDATTITSDHVYLGTRTTHIGGGPATMTIKGTVQLLTLVHADQPTSAAGCTITYHTIGMRGHGAQHTTTTVGSITLAAPPNLDDEDNISGIVQITASPDESRSLDDWTAACDQTVEHLLPIISLAQGKRIHWTIKQTFHEQQLVRSELLGPRHTGSGFDAVFHFLNLQPVLDLAINQYTDDLRKTTGIELAINLLLVHPRNAELLLVSSMTALEHLVSSYHEHVPPPLDEDTFKKTIAPALKDAYDTITTTLARPNDQQERDRFEQSLARVRDRINNLNHTTFTDRLFHLLRHYHVPLNGIEDRITKVIKARQAIIHTGKNDAPFSEFYLQIAVLRELLKRIILSLLEYEGEYISFLNGQEFVRFPPTETTVHE